MSHVSPYFTPCGFTRLTLFIPNRTSYSPYFPNQFRHFRRFLFIQAITQHSPQGGAPKTLAKLVDITPISLEFLVYRNSYTTTLGRWQIYLQLRYGGFLSHGGYPQKTKLDHSSIETGFGDPAISEETSIYIHTHIVPILSRIIIRIYVNQKKKHPYSGYIVTIAIYPDIII